MKKRSLLCVASILISFQALSVPDDFVNPLDFTGTKEERNAVIRYIERNVKDSLADIDVTDPMSLRLMEKADLDAFKELTKATDRDLFEKVLNDYCDELDVCDYNALNLMYKEQLKASKETLSW
ncbi:hypothetical protein BIY27_11585 [Gibbsiella quercinecans]|uniref:hypothetical protein n=1 Tax=Gibbsiella quercinecans TaxID=929813 RepID=UPI000EF20DC3|nr:hypothetical protein [Gibbsiella quercinecans]RLM12594.1 hypothetical protein BIY27_11585 [Gibbsiella quercinecans]